MRTDIVERFVKKAVPGSHRFVCRASAGAMVLLLAYIFISSEPGIIAVLLLMALPIFLWYLCMHDWTTRNGRDAFVVNELALEYTSKTPMLSFATDLWADFGRRRWRVPKSEISRIFVEAGRSTCNATLTIVHKRGKEVLRLVEWILDGIETPDERVAKDSIGQSELGTGGTVQHPIVTALMKHGYAVVLTPIKANAGMRGLTRSQGCNSRRYLPPWAHAVMWFLAQCLGYASLAIAFVIPYKSYVTGQPVQWVNHVLPLVALVAFLAVMFSVRRKALFTARDLEALIESFGGQTSVRESLYIFGTLGSFRVTGYMDQPFRDFKPFQHGLCVRQYREGWTDITVGSIDPRYMHHMSAVILWTATSSDPAAASDLKARLGDCLIEAGKGSNTISFGQRRQGEAGQPIGESPGQYVEESAWHGLLLIGGSWEGRKFCERLRYGIERMSVAIASSSVAEAGAETEHLVAEYLGRYVVELRQTA